MRKGSGADRIPKGKRWSRERPEAIVRWGASKNASLGRLLYCHHYGLDPATTPRLFKRCWPRGEPCCVNPKHRFLEQPVPEYWHPYTDHIPT